MHRIWMHFSVGMLKSRVRAKWSLQQRLGRAWKALIRCIGRAAASCSSQCLQHTLSNTSRTLSPRLSVDGLTLLLGNSSVHRMGFQPGLHLQALPSSQQQCRLAASHGSFTWQLHAGTSNSARQCAWGLHFIRSEPYARATCQVTCRLAAITRFLRRYQGSVTFVSSSGPRRANRW